MVEEKESTREGETEMTGEEETERHDHLSTSGFAPESLLVEVGFQCF